MKKALIASILVVGLAAGFAFAHGNGGFGGRGWGGHMMGPGMMGGSYEMMGPGMMGSGMKGGYGSGYGNCPGASYFGQDGWNSEPHQKFLEDTVGLRKELNDKRFEYAEAQRNPETTREQLAAIEKEVIDIRTQLQEKAEQTYKQ